MKESRSGRRRTEPREGSPGPTAGAPGGRSCSAILDFCNGLLGQENWQAVCLALLRREGVLPFTFPKDEEESLKQFTFNGARVTFGNVEFLRGRFWQILGEIAEGGKFAPREIELLNTALAQARGMRFRLDRVLSPARDAEDTVFLRPLTFDLEFLLHFAVTRFLSGLEPQRLKKCPHCSRLFLLDAMHRKRFCTDSCRTSFHNRVRVETGRQALYMRRRREALRQKSEASTTEIPSRSVNSPE
ncbi:MAG: hypothetical protein HY618_06040 [Candidatus Tectomicrobia bacterium]|uniref:Uncharacterized protein n=1 Tax=Tectimicrobiota bacterium TaxID=2528274 RepID=A0A932ZUR1_UNCTE|nr:hypothetical protein [Candidatus Tectomicrobia bacterium]MBI4252003.1 hypothetical protein [Candidatus Tectomicrobia bacterium]